ncbi:MAG TPA: ATP-dependent DNA helicase UvrD2, partial [Acidimicrobiia bacterium]|nr:ATP-dependent DNA helicase UvrD2 [Acidimicrobiia bacterium]
ERFVVDHAALRDPAPLSAALHERWAARVPFVVDLQVDADALRAPETETRAPYRLDPGFEFGREHLYFLARANNYDGRDGRLVWGPDVLAARLGASEGGPADVLLGDGRPAWLDGGPRGTADAPDGHALVHRVRVEAGSLTPEADATTGATLAPDQLAAVTHRGGPARVIAPAGSGKTRVLTERFRLLVAGRGYGAGPVCAVAYNVRAKGEMEQRLVDLGDGPRRKIRTLHALGFDVLRRSRSVREVLSEWDVRRRLEPLVPVRPRANTDVMAPYLEALSEVRLGLVNPDGVEAKRDDVEGFAAMFEIYRERLHADGAIDHDEQIYGAIEVLCREPAIRRAFQSECRHLLVDEFQDLTPAQLLMLRLIAAPAYDVFGVGDDDQVIYGYAGADPAFLIDYARYFPGAAHLDLQVNYRCPPAVVRGAANLLTFNRRRVPKEIHAAKTGDDDALTIERRGAEQLADGAVARVRAVLDAGAPGDDVAVLARVRSVLLPVQLLCLEAGIATNAPVGSDVLERTGVRAALAYLRLAAGWDADALAGGDIAIAARRPTRSIRREIMQRIGGRRRWTRGALRSLANDRTGRLEEFCDDLESLAAALRGGAGTEQLLRLVRDEIGLGRALETLDRSGRGPDASHRDDLHALLALAHLVPDPAGFEPWLRTRLGTPRFDPEPGEVMLSTVHRVKGMEWPHVVVLGAHDGLMPHHLSDDVEEERRVFHVAITRGDTSVHVVAEHGPARFLEELTRVATPADLAAPVRPVLTVVEPVPMSADEEMIEALKEWRRDRARADAVPAFVILHDSHLMGIAARAPRSLRDLARCPGIGPTKLERYGDEIIATVSSVRPDESS